MSEPDSLRDVVMLTEKDVARITGFSKRTLQGWRWKGTGPPFLRISASCIRYHAEDIKRWVAETRRVSTSDPGPALPPREVK